MITCSHDFSFRLSYLHFYKLMSLGVFFTTTTTEGYSKKLYVVQGIGVQIFWFSNKFHTKNNKQTKNLINL